MTPQHRHPTRVMAHHSEQKLRIRNAVMFALKYTISHKGLTIPTAFLISFIVPECKAAVRELLRVLRPGGLLLMAESSVPFCLSDGSDPPIGTATRELLEIVRGSIRESGLDPELRLKLASEVRNNPQVDKLDTCDFPLPLGEWPEDVSLQPVGRNGLENLAVGLRSLTPLLRQVGYDDAMMSMLASRLHEEWDINEKGAGIGKAFLCTFLWATKRR
ncbi:hypothetical protein FRC12_011400 [Ceratobasidium sp. 428]|nr:hypothetical protein FRC12_011400 [Ceratobasidium sp. 428]